MSARRFLSYWYTGLAIAGAVVGAVALLLGAIIVTGQRIRANAQRILAIADQIVDNTRPIWKLSDTAAASAQLREGAAAIAQHASEVAGALDAPVAHT